MCKTNEHKNLPLQEEFNLPFDGDLFLPFKYCPKRNIILMKLYGVYQLYCAAVMPLSRGVYLS